MPLFVNMNCVIKSTDKQNTVEQIVVSHRNVYVNILNEKQNNQQQDEKSKSGHRCTIYWNMALPYISTAFQLADFLK